MWKIYSLVVTGYQQKREDVEDATFGCAGVYLMEAMILTYWRAL